ncbi:MAG TPA: SDR family oxidoreductase [Bacteroidota bacterium]|nr:SDR family oxidoreductase [Bacteroidota bacterium]
MMAQSNHGRVVWITGASSGIGKALAEVFAQAGDMVILSARRESPLKSLARRIRAHGGSCEVTVCDVRSEKSLRRAAKRITSNVGWVDVLINNAGVTSFKRFDEISTREFDEVIATNLRGAFLATKAVLDSMVKRRRGVILNIISFAAKTTYEGSAAYSASKAGVESMMNVLRAETRGRGLKVVNVYPGAILTPMWKAEHRRKYSNVMMSPKEIARLIYEASIHPSSGMVEELVVRPQIGDLRV